jgi:hypothetical protein
MKMSNKKGKVIKTLTIHGIWMERIVTDDARKRDSKRLTKKNRRRKQEHK